MKKRWKAWVFLLFVGLTTQSIAQTNTFPNSGNVGIGTTSPSSLLDVDGTASVHSLLINGQNLFPNGGYQALGTGSRVEFNQVIFNNLRTKPDSPSSNPNIEHEVRIYYSSAAYNGTGFFRFLPRVDGAGQYGREFGYRFDARHWLVDNTFSVGTSNSEGYTLNVGGTSQFKNNIVVDGGGNQRNPSLTFIGDLDTGIYANLADHIKMSAGGNHMLSVTETGVGIETSNLGGYTLNVNGTARAKEITVSEDTGADFVFEKNYKLATLTEVEKHIENYKHLPDIPSADEMKRNGVKIGDFQMRLLQKIEELTLYVIKQEKKYQDLKADLESEIKLLKKRLR